MNLRIIGIIIGREYRNRVQKKSFLVTTFVVPVLMAALCIVPIVLMTTSKEKTKKIAVTDQSGIVMPLLEDTATIDYVDYCDFSAEEVKAKMEDLGIDAVLNISPLLNVEGRDGLKTLNAELTSLKPLGMDMTQSIGTRVNDALEAWRIDYYKSTYRLDVLEQILQDVKTDVKLTSYTMDEQGKETISETGVVSILSMVMGLLIFLFITLFGGMVMSAVIEEKTSRVVEVLVSSVKATELMFGKIIGIAMVAITQFVLWIVLTLVLVAGAGAVMGDSLLGGGSDPTELVQSMGVDSLTQNSEVAQVLETLKGIPVAEYLIYFLVFFVFGYMLYASLYAAIGSAVENEGDSQQLQLPVTIPLMIGYFIALYAFNAPDSNLALWGSIIPFTSPMVMLARLPFGVPGWQMAVSIAALVLTFGLCAWLSAKIYKVGILMFGKKSTFKDLWKWLKQN